MHVKQADIELAAAIVIHRDRVLLVQRSKTETLAPGVWAVPCGKLDQGERPYEAVLRELHEETGLNGAIIAFAETRVFRSVWRGRWIRNLQWNFLVKPEVNPEDIDDYGMPRVRPPKTDQDSRWVHTNEIDTVDGVDEHNLGTIRQGLRALTKTQGVSCRYPVARTGAQTTTGAS